MGTIAELLGYTLDPDENQTETPQASQDSTDVQNVVTRVAQQAKVDASAARSEMAREIAMAALLDESGYEASQMRADLRLVDDLDIDMIGRYAIVAAIEHELHVRFSDIDVDSWKTVDDVLVAAEHTH